MTNPKDILRHHVTGAIERGEATPIIGQDNSDRDTCNTSRANTMTDLYLYELELYRDAPVINRDTARRIVVDDHRVSWDDFLDDFGSRASYNTRSLFTWLGY